MSVMSTRTEDGKLELLIDNGDLLKIDEAILRWKFKDEQSFLRFVVSALLETEDTKIGIIDKGILIPIIPAKHSLKD